LDFHIGPDKFPILACHRESLDFIATRSLHALGVAEAQAHFSFLQLRS
jgi:hypothetical protein